MKHSLPSGAQRTCQSPKVSRTTSITSGLAGLPSRRASGAGALPERRAGRRRRRLGRRGRRRLGRGGRRCVARARPPPAGPPPGRRSPGRRAGAASASPRAARTRRIRIGCIVLLASLLIASSGIVAPRPGCQPRASGVAARSRPSEKGTRRHPFPRFRDFPVGLAEQLPRTLRRMRNRVKRGLQVLSTTSAKCESKNGRGTSVRGQVDSEETRIRTPPDGWDAIATSGAH